MRIKRKGCLVVIGAVIVIAAVAIIGSNILKPRLPETTYMVTTASRTYFTDNVTQDGKTYIMHGYYENLKGKWVLQNRDLPLDPAIFGKVEIKGAKK